MSEITSMHTIWKDALFEPYELKLIFDLNYTSYLF